jgi:hypothetical protein
MRFSEENSRIRFASMVVHSFIFTPEILDLAEVIAGRMRELNGGRLWMGAHMRRGDCKFIFISTPYQNSLLIPNYPHHSRPARLGDGIHPRGPRAARENTPRVRPRDPGASQ